VFVVTETDGIWGTAAPVTGLAPAGGGQPDNSFLAGLSCGGVGDCSMGGNDDTGSGDYAVIANETGGTWGAAHKITGVPVNSSGASEVQALSCAAAGYCSAAVFHDGYVRGAYFTQQFVVNEATVSATTLAVPTPKATYGDEEAVRLSATVASPEGGTPTGTAAVTAGTAPVCTITLTAGTGSCTPASTSVPAGTYQLTATYSGDTTYVGSASATQALIVAKAVSRASLSLSNITATYGHENTEHLTVTVAPQYRGTPVGEVTVIARKTILCVITLNKAGKGTCTLTARQLKAGTYTLTASYGGSGDFSASVSGKKTLEVAK